MDFKTIIFAMMTLASCQVIDYSEPAPIVLKTKPVGGSDTLYTTCNCTTNSYLVLDGSTTMWLSSQNMSIFNQSGYSRYYYYDLSSNYIEIYIKKQKNVPKKFKIIPYNPTLQFSNYHEAMIRVYLYYSGGFYSSKSGEMSLFSAYDFGFCDVKFIKEADGTIHSMDLNF